LVGRLGAGWGRKVYFKRTNANVTGTCTRNAEYGII
jgi:hypothetical protein